VRGGGVWRDLQVPNGKMSGKGKFPIPLTLPNSVKVREGGGVKYFRVGLGVIYVFLGARLVQYFWDLFKCISSIVKYININI